MKNDFLFDYSFKYIIVGDSAVGKSCILSQLINKSINLSNSVTIGVEFASLNIKIDDTIIKLHIWDTAGLEIYKSLTISYFRNTSAIFFVYDITNLNTFENIEQWINEVKLNGNINTLKILIGNKKDLDSNRKVSFNTGCEFAKKNDMLFFETTATLYENINEIFYSVTANIVHKIKSDPNYMYQNFGIKNGNSNVDLEKKKNKDICCNFL